MDAHWLIQATALFRHAYIGYLHLLGECAYAKASCVVILALTCRNLVIGRA